MTIWIDVAWNGPFYAFAIYAIGRGRDWIRVPALVWSRQHERGRADHLGRRVQRDAPQPAFRDRARPELPWLALPLATVVRMAREHPFTRPAAAPAELPRPAASLSVAAMRVRAIAAVRWRHRMKTSTKPAGDEQPPEAGSYARAEAERVFLWYARNARSSRYRFQISEMILLVVSAAVPVAGILTPGNARPAAIIGAGVVVLNRIPVRLSLL